VDALSITVTSERGDVHVLPIGDLREHAESRYCWCGPRIEAVNETRQTALVVHHSADGRELVEQHGVN
jgi:hypothetical protein